MDKHTFGNMLGWTWLLCWLMAIWTPEPISHKFFGTGAFCLLVIFLLVMGEPE